MGGIIMGVKSIKDICTYCEPTEKHHCKECDRAYKCEVICYLKFKESSRIIYKSILDGRGRVMQYNKDNICVYCDETATCPCLTCKYYPECDTTCYLQFSVDSRTVYKKVIINRNEKCKLKEELEAKEELEKNT